MGGWNKGKSTPKEVKQKISSALLGIKRTKNTKLKMSIAKKGIKFSEEHLRNLSLAHKGKDNHQKGRKHTNESKLKMSISLKGKKKILSTEQIKKNSERMIGHKNPAKKLEIRQKISLANSGKNHYNWKGGISKNPYPKEFNCELKRKIRERDNFTCCLCGRTEREELEELNQSLCVNHIDFDKQNCKENNLNTLCTRCNVAINRKREYYTNFFNHNI